MDLPALGTLSVTKALSRVFLVIAVAVLFSFATSQSLAETFKGRALIVGVNDYTDPVIEKLTCSDSDAHLIASLLSDPARGVFGPGNVRVLTDDNPDPAHKPTRLNILEGVQWLGDAQADETVLLYFSGHGCVDGGKQFIASQDTKLTALRFTAVSVDDVNSILDDPGMKAHQVVVIFDSCHSGVRQGAKAMTSESAQAIEGFMNDAEGRVTLASCGADEFSFEDSTTGHGVYTYFLSEGLKGAADANGDGLITVGELNNYARKKVMEWAKAHGQAQTPRVQSNVSGDIVLARDPVKFADAQQSQTLRRADLTTLRSHLLQRIGSSTADLEADDGAVLLHALDDEIAGNMSPVDTKLESVTRQFCANSMTADAATAEVLATSPDIGQVSGSTATPDHINVQLFQPAWQPGSSADDFTVPCTPGQSIPVVGLATSSVGISQVLLDGDIVKSRSLGAREIVLVHADTAPSGDASLSDMRFTGTVHAGSAPSTVVVTIVDVTGARRLIQLHLKPAGPPSAADTDAPLPAVAVIGLGHAQVDDYEELRAERIGQGFHNVLTRAARDEAKFTLVEEKTDVLKALVDRQWLQKSTAFDQSTAIQTGKLMGAKYVLYGEVYDFASPKENRGKLFMQVEVRLVNVETGSYIPGYGKADAQVPKGESGDVGFDRSTLADVSDRAIRAALADVFSKVTIL